MLRRIGNGSVENQLFFSRGFLGSKVGFGRRGVSRVLLVIKAGRMPSGHPPPLKFFQSCQPLWQQIRFLARALLVGDA